ncbi:MAG: hypothetical protein WC656_01370 [Sulfurimonas sp.]|jgi:hypothetical protein
MGAYLNFQTKSNPNEVMAYLDTNSIQKKLYQLEEQSIFIVDDEHLAWVKKERPDMLEMETKKYGKGDIKTSGGISFKTEEAGITYEDLAEMWVQLFEELNKQFKMKYYAHSCSLSLDSSYFTLEQMKRITNNGKLLSGKSSKNEHVVALYNKYYAAFSEPEEEVFDISIVNKKDYLFVNEGWRKVEKDYTGKLWIHDGVQQFTRSYIADIPHLIEDHKKYVPKIRYMGSHSDIEAFIQDGTTLIYLETIGQEAMIKSITSVLMQGRVKMNDHDVESDAIQHFDINKAGNKRKLVALDDGIAHAILYHAPSIVDANFSVLIGRDNDELLSSFSAWMEKSQPLPYPKNLTKEIYTKLQEKDKLDKLTSLNIEAAKVDLSILEEECYDLQEIILEVCREHGLISPDAKPLKQKAPLPKSPSLTVMQVQKIYDTLEEMPKTYSLDGVAIKPVGLKLFNHNMTAYVVEADSGNDDDEFIGLQSQCFGFVENLSAPDCSEWGYINIEEYIGLGFEMDLFFENMYIDSNGRVDTLENLKIKEAA